MNEFPLPKRASQTFITFGLRLKDRAILGIPDYFTKGAEQRKLSESPKTSHDVDN